LIPEPEGGGGIKSEESFTGEEEGGIKDRGEKKEEGREGRREKS